MSDKSSGDNNSVDGKAPDRAPDRKNTTKSYPETKAKKQVPQRQSSVRHNLRTREEMSGWLYKKGRRLGRKERRFFKLSGTVLANHRDPSMDATWEINLLNCEVLGGDDNTEVIIKVPNRTLRLYAVNREEMEKWVESFNRASNMLIDNFYDICEIIGKGEFGIVRRGVDKETKQNVAIKAIRKKDYPPEDYHLLEREVNILLKLQHPGIVRTLDIFETEEQLYIVMEYMLGGMLFDIIAEQPDGAFTEKAASQIMIEIFTGIEYLHDRGIVHRDIKPENVLCGSKNWPLKPKLSDFGLANFIERGDRMLETQVGTPVFAAPEVVKNETHGSEVDIWSCGVLLYNLLSGELPFDGDETDDGPEKMFQKIINCDYTFPDAQWKYVSEEAKDLIKQCLVLDPSKRITASQAVKHPWFKSGAGESGRLSYNPSRLHSSMRSNGIFKGNAQNGPPGAPTEQFVSI